MGKYRVIPVALIFLIWLKMTLKIIGDRKATHFYNHKDPPFNIETFVKIDLNRRANFRYLFLPLSKTSKFVSKPCFSNCLNLKIQYFKLYDM